MASYNSDNSSYYYSISRVSGTYSVRIISAETNKEVHYIPFVATTAKAHKAAKHYIKTLSQPN